MGDLYKLISSLNRKGTRVITGLARLDEGHHWIECNEAAISLTINEDLLTINVKESKDPEEEVFLGIADEATLGHIIKMSHIKELSFRVASVPEDNESLIEVYGDDLMEITYLDTRPSRGKERE